MTAPIDPDAAVPMHQLAKRPLKPKSNGTTSGARVIRLRPELHECVDEAVEALGSDADLYQRDGFLVQVLRASEADDLAIADTPTVRRVLAATLRERLTRVARWERVDRKSGKWIATLPSDHVVQAALVRGEWPAVRPIVGVLESPSMRPDGSVIQIPGYDKATGYVYMPNARFPGVPDRPSRVDAQNALEQLLEPFVDFPYRFPCHRSVALAAILSLIARPAIRGPVPGFVFDANTRGSGKTLQADVVSTIATGRPTAKMSWPTEDDELEKVLASYALRAAALVNFDNVVRPFGGGPLDRCLTAIDTVELRVLGKSEVPALHWRAIVLATGNNVDLTGDTARRVLLSRIESPLENPEERADFKHPDLLPWCARERPRLVAAALTLLRAFVLAGRPTAARKPMGSFDAWSTLVPPAIVWAGGADPLDSRPAVEGREGEDKRLALAIVDGWQRLDPEARGMTIKTVLGLLYPPGRRGSDHPPDGFEDLRDAMETATSTKPGMVPSSKAVGNHLRKLRGRVFGGASLDAELDRKGVAKWAIRAPGVPGLAGSLSPPRGREQNETGEPRLELTRQHPADPAGSDGGGLLQCGASLLAD